MFNKNVSKQVFITMFTMIFVLLLGTAANAATTPLKDVVTKQKGETFTIDGTVETVGSEQTIKITGADEIKVAEYVKQGMTVSPGGSVKSVDFKQKEATPYVRVYVSNPGALTGTTFTFTVPNNDPGAADREHNNDGTENLGDKRTGETFNGTTGDVKLTSGPHGRFVSNTNACGRCHQLHAAQSSRLIRFKTDTTKNTIYGICTYCHSFNGQSTYDVRNGQIWDTDDGTRYATNGGGFENMLVIEGKPGTATYASVTAKHGVDYGDSTTAEPIKMTAPGGKNMGIQLKCTACHQPHGTANDRLLVESVTQEDGGQKDTWYSYAPANNTADASGTVLAEKQGSFTGATGPVKVVVENPFGDESTYYNAKIVDFCAQCHVDYAFGSSFKLRNKTNKTFTDGTAYNMASSTSDLRSSRKGTGYYEDNKYRHMMAMKAKAGLNGDAKVDNTYGFDAKNILLPLATVDNANFDHTDANKGEGIVVCTTCHYAHGTFTKKDSGIKTYDEIDLGAEAAAAGYAPSGLPGKLNKLGGTETAKNLRLDDRGVCQNCHNRNPDQTPPSLVNVLNVGTIVADTEIAGAGVSTDDIKVNDTNKTVVIRFKDYMRSGDVDGSVEWKSGYTNPNPYSIGTATVVSAKLQQDKRSVVITYTGTAPSSVTISNVKNTNGVIAASLSATVGP